MAAARDKSGLGEIDATELPNTILIAEDEHLVATDLAMSLESIGVGVVAMAPNGKIAVELAKEHKPDLALMDIRMPVMDGLEAAEIIYKQFGIPVVISSAYTDEDYLTKSSQIGVFGYLLKPVTPDDLRVSLTVSWARYKTQEDLAGQIDDLKQALENRKLVEKAKGLIQKRLNIDEPEAMKRLQKQARDSRRPLHDLARAILESDELLGNSGD
jgi:response regulator NasT